MIGKPKRQQKRYVGLFGSAASKELGQGFAKMIHRDTFKAFNISIPTNISQAPFEQHILLHPKYRQGIVLSKSPGLEDAL